MLESRSQRSRLGVQPCHECRLRVETCRYANCRNGSKAAFSQLTVVSTVSDVDRQSLSGQGSEASREEHPALANLLTPARWPPSLRGDVAERANMRVPSVTPVSSDARTGDEKGDHQRQSGRSYAVSV